MEGSSPVQGHRHLRAMVPGSLLVSSREVSRAQSQIYGRLAPREPPGPVFPDHRDVQLICIHRRCHWQGLPVGSRM